MKPSKTRIAPNFGSRVTECDLAHIAVSAHALRRFVERLQPGIPGGAEVAAAMACLEQPVPVNRSASQQALLNHYRDWMARQVQPYIMQLIRAEGYWATARPPWSRSSTPADGLLQIASMCLFPAARHGQKIVLATCTNGRGMTWEVAFRCGYVGVPRPFGGPRASKRRPSRPWATLERWRARRSGAHPR
jgi:hypothetical protein